MDSEFKMADMPTSDDFARLESEVEKNPTSEAARENLLDALSADPERFDDPRRFELIEWFLEHNPRHSICSTPFMRVNPESAPDAYAKLKARWLALVADAPADPQLVRGAAAFVAAESLDEGKRLLQGRARAETRRCEAVARSRQNEPGPWRTTCRVRESAGCWGNAPQPARLDCEDIVRCWPIREEPTCRARIDAAC